MNITLEVVCRNIGMGLVYSLTALMAALVFRVIIGLLKRRSTTISLHEPQRLLFVQMAANLGGSQNSTYTRMVALRRLGIQSESLFYRKGAGLATYDGFPTHIIRSRNAQALLVQAEHYDLISIINVVTFISVLRQIGYRGRVIVEIRGRAERSLGKLPDISSQDIDAIVVPSQYVKSLVAEVLQDRRIPIHVLPNAIDTTLFHPVELMPGAYLHQHTGPKRIIMWVGRLSPVKNWPELLQIAAQVTDRRDDIEFWIAGDTKVSPDTEAFRMLRHRLGLGSRVRVLPCLPYHEMPNYYAQVRSSGGCVISTSLSEGMQNSILEAMACGVPVVSSAIGGNKEIIRHGYDGFLYRLGDPTEATEYLLRLLGDKKLWQAFSARGLQRIEKEHSTTEHARAFLEIVSRLPARNN